VPLGRRVRDDDRAMARLSRRCRGRLGDGTMETTKEKVDTWQRRSGAVSFEHAGDRDDGTLANFGSLMV
jgi:hypothetical protein